MSKTSRSIPLVAAALERSSDLAIVLGVSWLARVIFVFAIGDAHSLDVDHWQRALEAQHDGQNPYETGVLNWPPFWLQIIVLLDAIASHVDISFWTALRIYLVLAESALIITLYLTLVSVGARPNAVRRALLVGIALNPVAILLVCQHGNSDVNVGLLVTLAVAALIAYRRSRDVVFWLASCLLLGVGVLAKTVPLVLAPMLAPGARLAGKAGTALGAALFLGPAALGLSVIMAFAPGATQKHVIGYRSFPGYFGVEGLLDDVTTVHTWVGPVMILALVVVAAVVQRWRRPSRDDPLSPNRMFLLGALLFMAAVFGVATLFDRLSTVDVRPRYGTLFTLLVIAMVAWLMRRLWQESPLTPQQLFLLVAMTFMLVVAFGSGYGPQYAYWFIPALVATYVLLDDAWRRLLRIGYVVAGLTYMFEYGFIPWLGAWVPAVFGSSHWTAEVAEFLIPYRLVLVNVPLFVVYLLVLAAGISRLAAPRTAERLAASAFRGA
jgi:hypothetical protein